MNAHSLFRTTALVACTLGAALTTLEPAAAATCLSVDAPAPPAETGPWALGLAARTDSATIARSDTTAFTLAALDSAPKLVPASRIAPRQQKCIAPQVGAGVGCILGFLLASQAGKSSTPVERTGDEVFDAVRAIGAGAADSMNDAVTMLLGGMLGGLLGYAVGSAIAGSKAEPTPAPPVKNRNLEVFEAKRAQLEASADSAATDTGAAR